MDIALNLFAGISSSRWPSGTVINSSVEARRSSLAHHSTLQGLEVLGLVGLIQSLFLHLDAPAFDVEWPACPP